MQQDVFHQPAPPVYDSTRQPTHYVQIYRVALVREATISVPRPQLRTSQDAADLFRRLLGRVDREHFLVALLDRKHKVIGVNTVSIGSLTASVVHPREVLCAVRGFVSYRYSK